MQNRRFKLLIEWNAEKLYALTGIRQDSTMIGIESSDMKSARQFAKGLIAKMADCYKKSFLRLNVVELDDSTELLID